MKIICSLFLGFLSLHLYSQSPQIISLEVLQLQAPQVDSLSQGGIDSTILANTYTSDLDVVLTLTDTVNIGSIGFDFKSLGTSFQLSSKSLEDNTLPTSAIKVNGEYHFRFRFISMTLPTQSKELVLSLKDGNGIQLNSYSKLF